MELLKPTLLSVLWLFPALAIFLLPGWVLSRRLSSPAFGLTAFFGSAATLFHLVLILNALGVPLHAGTVGTGLALISAGIARFLPRQGVMIRTSHPVWVRGWDWLWFAPPALALVSIVARATIEPLSGYDNLTRWDYLARLFLTRGSLAGYPPLTAADFEYYSWCDGIPPLVPLLNFWIYTVTGSVSPALTATRVIGEALLLGNVVFRYAGLLWGDSGRPAAVAALATSALALWAVSMGQETGLTAVSLVSMLYFLELHARTSKPALLFWAGLAAGIGALTRDYGLSFPILGFLVLIFHRQIRPRGTIFVLTAAVVAAPWYMRNWILTGNLLYPQTLGGLFPGNAVHNEIMRYIADVRGLRSSAFSTTDIVQVLAVLAGLVAIAGLVGIARGGKRGLPAVGGIVLVSALWIWSVSQTAGGWIYSMRMLSPALALLAVLGGWLGGLRSGFRVAILAICFAGAADAARRSWVLPDRPYTSPLTVSFGEWREIHADLRRIRFNPVWDHLVRLAAGRGIIVDHTAHHALITMRGGNAIPLFSPLIAATFGNQNDFDATLANLRSANVRFVTISFKNSVGNRLVRAHPFWTKLCLNHKPNAEVQSLSIFDLDHLFPLDSLP